MDTDECFDLMSKLNALSLSLSQPPQLKSVKQSEPDEETVKQPPIVIVPRENEEEDDDDNHPKGGSPESCQEEEEKVEHNYEDEDPEMFDEYIQRTEVREVPMMFSRQPELPPANEHDSDQDSEDGRKETMFMYPSFRTEEEMRDDIMDDLHPDIQWVVSEKMHGCNFQLRCNLKNMHVHAYTRKKRLLPGDKFFSWEAIRHLYKNAVRDIAKRFGANISVFGEIIGGHFPGMKKMVTGGPVQKLVYYCPDYRFVAFDVYNHDKKTFCSYNTMIESCRSVGIPTPPEYRRGLTLAEAFDLNVEGEQSGVCAEMFGLTSFADNVWEGLVIRPESGFQVFHGVNYRGFYKRRTSRFLNHLRVNYDHDYKRQPKTTVDDEYAKIISAAKEAALENILSKELEGTLNMQTIYKFANLVLKEIVDSLHLHQPNHSTRKKVMADIYTLLHKCISSGM